MNAAVLALALGLSGCVIPRNPFPLSSAAGAPGPGPVALLPIGEADVRSYGGVPTNKVVRVTNRVLNSIASSKNNLIGPEMLARGDTASAQRAVRTRVAYMPSAPEFSIVSCGLNVEKSTQVLVEMELLEGEPPAVIAKADATETCSGNTQCILVFPVFYAGETLGSATDRAARRALIGLFNPANRVSETAMNADWEP